MLIRWRVVLAVGALYATLGLSAAQLSQDSLEINRNTYAIRNLEDEVEKLRATNIEARLRLLEDSREESRQMLRVISAVLLGHIITAIWQKQRGRK